MGIETTQKFGESEVWATIENQVQLTEKSSVSPFVENGPVLQACSQRRAVIVFVGG